MHFYAALKYKKFSIAKYIKRILYISIVLGMMFFLGLIGVVYPTHYLGGGCYEEARRVLGKIKWEPAIKNGKPVRCKISHTVYFNLPNQSPKGRDPIAE